MYKKSEVWPSICFCSIAAHQALCFQQGMAENMMTFGALKLKGTCEGNGNVMKSVTTVLTVTQLPFRPVVAPLLG
jgi:hypothetical protein